MSLADATKSPAHAATFRRLELPIVLRRGTEGRGRNPRFFETPGAVRARGAEARNRRALAARLVELLLPVPPPEDRLAAVVGRPVNVVVPAPGVEEAVALVHPQVQPLHVLEAREFLQVDILDVDAAPLPVPFLEPGRPLRHPTVLLRRYHFPVLRMPEDPTLPSS